MNPRTLAAAAAASVLVCSVAACGTGVPAACRGVQAREFAEMRADTASFNAAAVALANSETWDQFQQDQQDESAVLARAKRDLARAQAAMHAAGCPSTMQLNMIQVSKG